MGRFKGLILIVLALGLAGITAITVQNWLASQRARFAVQQAGPQNDPNKDPPVRVAQVLVAAGELAPGQFLRPENMRWQPWPESNIAPAYVVEGRRPMNDFVGSVVRHQLSAGEPITEGKVVTPGSTGFLAAVLTPGMRATSINVSPTSGISGFIFAGDRVDVIMTHDLPPEGNGGANLTRRAAVTMLRNLRVLAMDQRVDQRANEPLVARTATLEVTPRQIELLAVAAETGRLSLSLRSLGRDDQEQLPPANATAAVPASFQRVAQADQPAREAAPQEASEGTPARAEEQSFSLDSDTTMLLPPPNQRREPPRITVFRGQRAEQVTIEDAPGAIRGGPR